MYKSGGINPFPLGACRKLMYHTAYTQAVWPYLTAMKHGNV